MAVIPSTGQDWQSFRYVALHEKTAVFMVVLDRICMSQDVYTWHTQEVEFSMEHNHFINLLKCGFPTFLGKGGHINLHGLFRFYFYLYLC